MAERLREAEDRIFELQAEQVVIEADATRGAGVSGETKSPEAVFSRSRDETRDETGPRTDGPPTEAPPGIFFFGVALPQEGGVPLVA